MNTYIVVDSNNQWLWYGKAERADQAHEYAKQATEYDKRAGVYVYEVANETYYPGQD